MSLIYSTAGQSQSLESVIIDEMFYQDIRGLSVIVVNPSGTEAGSTSPALLITEWFGRGQVFAALPYFSNAAP